MRKRFAKMSNERFARKFETVKKWSNSLIAPNTRRQYFTRLRFFCDWAGKDPDALIEERFSHLRSRDVRKNHAHEDMIAEFLNGFEKDHCPRTVANYAAAIRSFYKYNRADLKFVRRTPAYNIRKEKVPTKEEVKKMCEVSDTRGRAVILFQHQSGLRNETTSKLRYGDVAEDLEAGRVPVRIHVMPEHTKNHIEHDTFIGRDAAEALKKSLDERRRGVAVKGAPPEKITRDSPLFRAGRIKVKGVTAEVPPITSNAIGKIVVGAVLKAGIVEPSVSDQGARRRYVSLHAHCLRKAFQTTLEAARVPGNWVTYMMGHKLPGVEGAYSKPSVAQLREAYAKAEPLFSISQPEPVLTSEEIEALVDKRVQERLRAAEKKRAKADDLMGQLLEDREVRRLLAHKIRELGLEEKAR